MADRRYFDSDVRANPELLDLAVDYVWNYTGDFEFLLTARELARITDTLPIPTARGVLNCMRGDPHVAATLPFQPRLASTEPIPFGSYSQESRRRYRPPSPPLRRNHIDVPTTVKARYGISGFRGYKTHLVKSARCLFKDSKGYHGRPSGNPEFPWAHFDVTWWCNNQTAWPTLMTEPAADADFCAKCLEWATLELEEDEAVG